MAVATGIVSAEVLAVAPQILRRTFKSVFRDTTAALAFRLDITLVRRVIRPDVTVMVDWA